MIYEGKICLASMTSTEWSTLNPVLLLGQKGIESDTDLEKNGDGIKDWNSLQYIKVRSSDIIGDVGYSGDFRTVGGINIKGTGDIPLDYVPTTRTINGVPLTDNINLDFVPTTRKINNIPLIGDITLSASDLGISTGTTNLIRVLEIESDANPTINTDSYDLINITGQATDIISFTTNLLGTPTSEQCLIINIFSPILINIEWGDKFESSKVLLPVTNTINTKTTIGFMYNSASSKWRCIGVS